MACFGRQFGRREVREKHGINPEAEFLGVLNNTEVSCMKCFDFFHGLNLSNLLRFDFLELAGGDFPSAVIVLLNFKNAVAAFCK